jgi:hypothetical protein
MARHASPRTPGTTARRALIALATAGAALGGAAATASAAPLPVLGQTDVQTGVGAVTGSVPYLTAPLTALKPNPLAGTGTDPLDNGVGTRIADFRPIDTRALTGPLAETESIGGLPLLGSPLGATGG